MESKNYKAREIVSFYMEIASNTNFIYGFGYDELCDHY